MRPDAPYKRARHASPLQYKEELGGISIFKENYNVKGLVLAGVHCWDHSSFDEKIPRPLIPVANNPLISYVLYWFYNEGVRKVTICANSASRQMRKYLSDGSQLGMDFDYYEDRIPRGPAGCIFDALTPEIPGTLIVAEGTCIPRANLTEMLEVHFKSKATLTIAVESGKNEFFTPAGIYMLDRTAVECIRETGYQDIKENLIPHLYTLGQKIQTYPVEPCLRVNNIESYLKTNEWVLRKIINQESFLAEYQKIGEGKIHFSASLGKDVKFIGPVIVGSETIIDNNVTIIGPSIIGRDNRVREQSIICRSIIWDGCTISKNCFIDQCVLPAKCEIQNQTRLYNTLYFTSANSKANNHKISKSECEICERNYSQIPFTRLFFMEKRFAARTLRM